MPGTEILPEDAEEAERLAQMVNSSDDEEEEEENGGEDMEKCEHIQKLITWESSNKHA